VARLWLRFNVQIFAESNSKKYCHFRLYFDGVGERTVTLYEDFCGVYAVYLSKKWLASHNSLKNGIEYVRSSAQAGNGGLYVHHSSSQQRYVLKSIICSVSPISPFLLNS